MGEAIPLANNIVSAVGHQELLRQPCVLHEHRRRSLRPSGVKAPVWNRYRMTKLEVGRI